jgi:hypothetical protein
MLRAFLSYDAETGFFHRVRDGKRAGYVKPSGYRSIRIGGTDFYEHRLAFFWETGRWPTDELDHINRDRADNRISNLREATTSQNQANAKADTRSRFGLKGVMWRPKFKRWRAHIRVNRRRIYIGEYSCVVQAMAAYDAAARKHFGEFACTNKDLGNSGKQISP